MQRIALLFGAFLLVLGMALSYVSAYFIADYAERLTTRALEQEITAAG